MQAPLRTRLNAQRMRREMTLPEVLLWLSLKGRQLGGFHFRKQHPVGPYILDFYCEALRLAVEVDGELHALDDRPERDAMRDQWFAKRGITTLRITARDVLASPDGVALGILEYVRAAPSVAPRQLPQKGSIRFVRSSPSGGGGPEGRRGSAPNIRLKAP